MKHEFLLKNALNKEQLIKKNTLFKNFSFEVHLSNEIENLSDLKTSETKTELGYLILDTFCDTPIKVIHTPFTKNNHFNIEEKNTKEILQYIIKTSEYVRKKQGYFKDIIVVIHNELSPMKMDQYGILSETIDILKNVSDEYPYVKIAIENTTGAYKIKEMNYFTNLELALLCDRKNIGTCLDTCHLKINKYIDDIMQQNYKNNPTKKIPTIDEFIKIHMEYEKLNLIHFANASDDLNGFGQNLGHGSGFFIDNNDDVNFAKEILSAYDKYGCKCPMTLELIEKDYLNPINVPKTLELLKTIDN